MNINVYDLVLAFVCLIPVILLVLLGQFLWSRNILKGEYSRKFVHILSAAWISTWRFFLPVWLVVAMALAMGVGVFLVKHLKVFSSIYSVKRITYGEVSYALAIAMTALLFRQPEVYFLCIINLGFADGLAALVGKKIGRRSKQSRFFGRKSFAGSATCFLFALVSGSLFWVTANLRPDINYDLGVIYVLAAALIIAAAELYADKGLDNIMITLVTGIIYGGVV